MLRLLLVFFAGIVTAAAPIHAQEPVFVPEIRMVPGSLRMAPQAVPWRLTLERVHVEQQREGGGDRPYFVSVAFESQLFRRGTTRVEVVEREPHDWVSKPEYRATGRVAAGRDHLFVGESLPIPAWMGDVRWQPVILAEPDLSAANARLFGVIVLGFDNNSTPPHAMRGLAEQAGVWLDRFLRERVESGRIASAVNLRTGTVSEEALNAQFLEFGLQILHELDAGRILETLFQATVGAAFNPDKLVGVHVLLFPAVQGIALAERSKAFSVPLLGEDVQVRLLVATPEVMNRTLLFEGDGARYTVPFRLTSAQFAATAPEGQLDLRLASGRDGVRRNSRARAVVTLRDGRTGPTAELNNGAEWADFSEHEAIVLLPPGTRLGDVEHLTVTYESGSTGPFDSYDNWDLDAVTVALDGGAGVVKVARGRPLIRFTGDTRTFTIPLR